MNNLEYRKQLAFVFVIFCLGLILSAYGVYSFFVQYASMMQ